jgi:hypothetical protein
MDSPRVPLYTAPDRARRLAACAVVTRGADRLATYNESDKAPFNEWIQGT